MNKVDISKLSLRSKAAFLTGNIIAAANLTDERASQSLIYTKVLALRVHHVVATEWGNEARRRDFLQNKALDKRERKQASKFGRKYDSYRRIIRSEPAKTGEKYEREYHATKGWRTYRAA